MKRGEKQTQAESQEEGGLKKMLGAALYHRQKCNTRYII